MFCLWKPSSCNSSLEWATRSVKHEAKSIRTRQITRVRQDPKTGSILSFVPPARLRWQKPSPPPRADRGNQWRTQAQKVQVLPQYFVPITWIC